MRLHRKIAKLFGYELLKSKRHQPNLESHLAFLLEKLNINVVLDVGANIGQYAKFLRKLGYKRKIISFEPVKSTYIKLKQESENDELWFAYNAGLGSESKEMKINVFQSSEMSSFLSANEFGAKIYGNNMEVESEETILITTLDSFIQENPGVVSAHDKILLKMDTQGFDLEVFKGARGQLGKIEMLQSEIPLKPIYEGMTNYHEVLEEFEAHNFELSGIYPVGRDENSYALIEIDCVFIKNHQIA